MKTKNAAVDADEVIRQVGMEITEDGTEIQHFEQVSSNGDHVDPAPAVTLTSDQEATLRLAAHIITKGHATTRNTAVSLAETLQITYPTATELLAEAVATINEH